MNEYEYDVAISCLKDDEPVARELRDLLHSRLRSIFLYTQNQKDGIGEDGVEWFKAVYRHQSRVVAVIYREGWGRTKWTGVEDRAIQDLYLNHGWRRILVYSIDDRAPSWLPENHLWGGKVYGLTAFAAAVERKVQEEGGNIGEEDVVAMAQRVHRERAAAEAREARRFTTDAVQVAHQERRAIYAHLAELVAALEASQPGVYYIANISGLETASTTNVSVGLLWSGTCVNSIQGDTLTLHVTLRPMGVRGWERENARIAATYELHLAEDDATWRWVEVTKGLHYSSAEIAENTLRQLIKEDEKHRKAVLKRRQGRS